MAPANKVLFVNKGLTSKSLSRSDGAEKSRIFSHVQQPPGSQLPLSSAETPGHSSDSISERFSGLDVTRKLTKRRKPTSKKGRPDCNCAAQSSPAFPLIFVSIAQLDLFGSPSAPITDYMNQVLEFYGGAMLERIYPSKILADVSRESTLSYAANDAVALNAILCTASGALYMHFGDMKHAHHAMYFKGQAIHHLKKELDRPDTQSIGISTLYAISLLLWLECLQGDMEAVETHIKGLDQLAGLVKGVCESPVPVWTTILSSSYYCSAMLRSRPVLQFPTTPSSTDSSISTTEMPSALANESPDIPGARFFTSLNAIILGPDLLGIVSAQTAFITFKKKCREGLLHPTYHDFQSIYTLYMQSDYQLLNMPHDPLHAGLSPLQNAVRLALYTHAQPIITVAKPSTAFSRSMTVQLKEALEETALYNLWYPNYDLLLWVLFIGAQISYAQSEWTWFVSHIAGLVDLLGLESGSGMQNLLEGFYYDPTAFDRTVELVWKEVDAILRGGESQEIEC